MAVDTINQEGLYSAKVASRIARIRYQNFQAWAKANLLHPTFKIQWDKKSESVYSYYDLLLIRLVKRLKDKGFRIKNIKAALDTIYDMSGEDPLAWTKSIIKVTDNIIAVYLSDKPEWNPVAASRGPQKMAVVFFPKLIEELKSDLIPNKFQHIEIDPQVLSGTPVIKGTRIPVALIFSIKREGGNPKEAYPKLTDDDISDAISYEEFLTAN